MTTYYSPFMMGQMAAGYDWTSKSMGLVLLTQAAAIGASTPSDLAGLLGTIGWQEVSTVASPTYARTTQTTGQNPSPPVTTGTAIAVIYGGDYTPLPTGSNAEPVYVAAGLWYINGTVAGVVNPWVFISTDMFANVVSPGVRIGGTPPRTFFSYVVRGTTVDITPAAIVQSPGTLAWESARIQDVYLFPQRVNWIPNPSFEDVGNFGWRSNGALTRAVPGVDNPNNHFLRTTGTYLQSIPIPVDQVFRFSAWVRKVTGTSISLSMWYLDEAYNVVYRINSPARPLYADWIRYDQVLVPPEDVAAVIPTLQADGSFDADLCLLEASNVLNYYYDGDAASGLPGDFSWQGQQAQSYSFWYNNRYVTAARLFGGYYDGQVTKPSLVFDWLPTGTSVATHWDVLSETDTKHPLKDWPSRLGPSPSAFLAPSTGNVTTPDTADLTVTTNVRWTAKVRRPNWDARDGSYQEIVFNQNYTVTALTGLFFTTPGASYFYTDLYAPGNVRTPPNQNIATGVQLTALYQPNVDAYIGGQFLLNDAGQSESAALTSTNGSTWTKFGIIRRQASVTGSQDPTGLLRIGGTTTSVFQGRIYWVQLETLDAAGNSTGVVWRFDAAEYPGFGTSYTDPRGRTWTLPSTSAITPF